MFGFSRKGRLSGTAFALALAEKTALLIEPGLFSLVQESAGETKSPPASRKFPY
jgi:hypothetical protein